MKRIFLLSFFILFSFLSFSQQIQERHFKIHTHVIRKTDKSGGASEEQIKAMLCTLSKDFKDQNIYFTWDGQIHNIDDDYIYDAPFLRTTDLVDEKDKQGGINIYFFGDNRQEGIGPTLERIKIGTGKRLANDSGDEIEIHKTSMITHEMGHFLGLLHPGDAPLGDPDTTTNPKNFMCEGHNNCGYITQWESFTIRQKQIIQDTIANNPVRIAEITDNDVVGEVSLCPPPIPPTCEKPDVNKIRIESHRLFGSTWISRAYYDGEIEEPIVWKWTPEIPHSVMPADNNSHSWAWWKYEGEGVRVKINVTNACGSTSELKELVLEPN